MLRLGAASIATTLSPLVKFASQSSKPLCFRSKAIRKFNIKVSFSPSPLFWSVHFGAGWLSEKIAKDPQQKRSFSGRSFSSYLLNAHMELVLWFACFKTRTTFGSTFRILCHVSAWSIFLWLISKP